MSGTDGNRTLNLDSSRGISPLLSYTGKQIALSCRGNHRMCLLCILCCITIIKARASILLEMLQVSSEWAYCSTELVSQVSARYPLHLKGKYIFNYLTDNFQEEQVSQLVCLQAAGEADNHWWDVKTIQFCHSKMVSKYCIFCCQLSQQMKISSQQATVYYWSNMFNYC